MKKLALGGVVALALGAVQPVAAHGIWIAERLGDLAIVYGHAASDEAYRPDKVVDAKAFGADGEARSVEIVRQNKNVLVRPAPEAARVTAMLDNGIWTKGADGRSVNRPKREVPEGREANHSIKTTTTLLARPGGAKDGTRSFANRPAGLPLEIVPLVDPLALKMGDDLPVQVLFEGKPLAGVAMNTDYVNDGHAKSAKTEAEGKATLFVRNDGLNVIRVAHGKPLPGNPDADRVSYYATLAFALPHEE